MSNDWQYLNVNGVPQSGSPTVGGGGGNPLSGYRSIIDARRSAATPARTPQAEYPDGYLGNINSRREDRLLQNIQSRLTQRSYQRGVHKGDRIDPSDYYWNGPVNPQAGLQAQAQGLKWTQTGLASEQVSVLGNNSKLRPEQVGTLAKQVGLKVPAQIDPERSSKMSRLLPRWK